MPRPNSPLPSNSTVNPSNLTGYGPRTNSNSHITYVGNENLESKTLGKIINHLLIVDEVILKGRCNYQLWHQALKQSLRYVDAGLYDYMMSNQADNAIYEEAAEMLLIRYVSE